ncbi:Cysteine desulfurase [Posidoniimonas corsicana]|uniref:cysteine desulfurase n=1 Tax=Posidoniimonas corsicana TaxID=1938618 RepID=A0A5C5VFZ4_9BACT|nr:cysteine desulfurase family protein [Posidoniimonas corsicana]TWT36552.1 Cysteine desulfurase [Posidoniimonas corsicana]
MTLYLDSSATTPIDPRVRATLIEHLSADYGNAGSPHEFGQRAKDAVHTARDQIGRVVDARRHEVVFTSGATESNNLALLGLAEHGLQTGRRHLVSTQIEHRAVLEPLAELRRRGFEVTLVPPTAGGWVSADAVRDAVRDDTLLVSVMHVNNETGIEQPIAAIADSLAGHDALLHVDAAQGFGKRSAPLRNNRIDLISVTAHKIHGPHGIGALVARRRLGLLPPLRPVLHGGGQELGLRSGTLPTALIAAFGHAAELAQQEEASRERRCTEFREKILAALMQADAVVHGDPQATLPHVASVSIPGLDADSVIDALAGVAAVSDGAACTTICATASHVLAAMDVAGPLLDGAVRLSWSSMTDPNELEAALPTMIARLQDARARHS